MFKIYRHSPVSSPRTVCVPFHGVHLFVSMGTCGFLEDMLKTEADRGRAAPACVEADQPLLLGWAPEHAFLSGHKQGAIWNTPSPDWRRETAATSWGSRLTSTPKEKKKEEGKYSHQCQPQSVRMTLDRRQKAPSNCPGSCLPPGPARAATLCTVTKRGTVPACRRLIGVGGR